MWISQEGREIHKTLQWAEGVKRIPLKVYSKRENYVSPRRNKRVARFRFHQRKQKDGESFDGLLKDLRLLALDCDFSDTVTLTTY